MSDKENLDKNVEVASDIKKSVCQEIPKIICDVRCKICNSPYLKAIHELRKAGNHYPVIVEIIKKKYNFNISTASLSRHFQKYQRHKNIIAAKVINDDLIDEATSQAVHTKKLVELIDEAFNTIKAKIKAGTLFLDVSDLEKLMKLRYQVMNGENTDENDVMAIFQKASNKYGLNLQQGVLFKSDSVQA